MEQKTCGKCGRELPATSDFFVTNKSKKTGIGSICKECERKRLSDLYQARRREFIERSQKWYEQNRDKKNRYDKERRLRDPEANKLKCRQYYATHKDEANTRSRDWRERNVNRKKEMDKAYYLQNRERVLERTKFYSTNNADTIRRYRFHLRLKDEFREREASRSRRYYERNADAIKAKRREWAKRNPEKVRQSGAAKRARRIGNGNNTLEADHIALQYANQKGLCHWCGEFVGDSFHVDHVVPLSKGGTNSPDNIVIACPPCNLRKHATLPEVFLKRLKNQS